MISGEQLCAACGTEHPAGARFCRRCGGALAAASAPPPVPEAEPAPGFSPRPASRRAGKPPVALIAGVVVSLALFGGAYAWFSTRSPEPLGGGTIAPPAVSPAAPLAAADAPGTPAGYADARTYCQVVGSIDQPDGRYTGPPMPDWIAQAMGYTPGAPGYVAWRCKDMRVWACRNGGITGPCDKRDLSLQPNEAMVSYCRDNPAADLIGAADTGHYTVYEWACQDGAPVATRQFSFPDADGYEAAEWQVLQ